MDRPATLADVASLAGVSLATASKAMNSRRDVSQASKERVLEAARQLAFTPNASARSLAFKHSGSVGMLTADLEGRFALAVMSGVEAELAQAGMVTLMTYSRARADLEAKHLLALLRRRVDGLIIIGDSTEPRVPLDQSTGVPTVYAYAPSLSDQDVSVLPDEVADGRLATEHLLELGRRDIAFISGPSEPGGVGSTSSLARLEGCVQALQAAGRPLAGGAPLSGLWSEQWGWQEAERLLKHAGPTGLDGLVCANDQIARGAIDLLISRDLRVPQDVAVVGFDDWYLFTAHGRLQQSSVDVNLREVGRVAARAILDPVSLPAGRHLVAGRLEARRSSVLPKL